MATMIPNDVESFKTRGEESFYRFLELAAKPDRRYTTWYQPDVEGREPDFILFSEDHGLIVFEVKDWSLDQIREASPRSFTLKIGHDLRQLKNPLHQAREYFEVLMDRIREDGRLLSRTPGFAGKPKVPIDYGLVFPNIRKDPYLGKGLDRVISSRRIFFRDHLDPASDACRDVSGECFHKALSEMFPPRFRFSIDEEDYHHLKQLLFPVVRIDDSPRDACLYVDPMARSRALDDIQEDLARRQARGLHLVEGPPGSGKTLVLVHKAAFMKRHVPQSRQGHLPEADAHVTAGAAGRSETPRILFLCANLTLTRHIKRLLAEKGVGAGPEGVEVLAFREFCSRLLGESVAFAGEGDDYAELVLSETLDRLTPGDAPRYDAVLVDDGHEFTRAMREIVFATLKDGASSLTVALDPGADAPSRAPDWTGRTELARRTRRDELHRIYRCTTEIREFWLRFCRGPGSADALEDASTHCEIHGPGPRLEKVPDGADPAGHVADIVRRLAASGEYPLSEIAVLVAGDSEDERPGRAPMEARLVSALEARGVLAHWVSEDDRSRAAYDLTTDRVTVSSVGGVRGLDYACVVLVGLDGPDNEGTAPGARQPAVPWQTGNPGEALPAAPSTPPRRLRHLARIGIARARHGLLIPYTRTTPLIERLIEALKN